MTRSRPTINDLALAVGVSKSAVSRALNNEGRVSVDVRDRVHAVAAELGYVKNLMAQTMASRRSHTIAFVARAARLSFYGELIETMQRFADQANYRIILAPGSEHSDDDHLLRSTLALQVDGLVLASGSLDLGVLEMLAGDVPTVIIGRGTRSGSPTGFVTIDDKSAASALADLVADEGHTHVGVIAVRRSISATRSLRSRTMTTRLKERNVEVLPISLAQQPDRPDAAELVAATSKVTAIMCPNDPLLIATADLLHLHGVRVPQDISLTGFDGSGDVGGPWIGLTTWRQPTHEMGTLAIENVLNRISDPTIPPLRRRLDGTLVRGRTLVRPAMG